MVVINKKTQEILDVVIEGLKNSPKQLPSYLFYDKEGDHLFTRIMELPEYYLTRCETEIFQTHWRRMLAHFVNEDESFDLVELGAGDGTKTEILLTHLSKMKSRFTYVPVDVSAHVLTLLRKRLLKTLPDLDVEPVHARIENLHEHLTDAHRRVFLYLGANIGNFPKEEARRFVTDLAGMMEEEDLLMIGFDLKKDPRLILSAYDDAEGVTRDFNLNLLRRLNRECDADFDIQKFSHFPTYDPQTGITRSFLVSNTGQVVNFGSNGEQIHFKAWETIQTEVSLKYDLDAIETLARHSGLRIKEVFYDKRKYFCDVVFTRV